MIQRWIQLLKPTKTELDDYVCVYRSPQEHLVFLQEAKLKTEDIPTFVINKKDSSYNNFGHVELYVKREHVVKAQYLINKTYE
jgi:hypothetical protein